jgi:predicted DNA repair protein MutK
MTVANSMAVEDDMVVVVDDAGILGGMAERKSHGNMVVVDDTVVEDVKTMDAVGEWECCSIDDVAENSRLHRRRAGG